MRHIEQLSVEQLISKLDSTPKDHIVWWCVSNVPQLIEDARDAEIPRTSLIQAYTLIMGEAPYGSPTRWELLKQLNEITRNIMRSHAFSYSFGHDFQNNYSEAKAILIDKYKTG